MQPRWSGAAPREPGASSRAAAAAIARTATAGSPSYWPPCHSDCTGGAVQDFRGNAGLDARRPARPVSMESAARHGGDFACGCAENDQAWASAATVRSQRVALAPVVFSTRSTRAPSTARSKRSTRTVRVPGGVRSIRSGPARGTVISNRALHPSLNVAWEGSSPDRASSKRPSLAPCRASDCRGSVGVVFVVQLASMRAATAQPFASKTSTVSGPSTRSRSTRRSSPLGSSRGTNTCSRPA